MDKADQQAQFIMHAKDEKAFNASFKKPFDHKKASEIEKKLEKDKTKIDAFDAAYLDGVIDNDQAKVLGIEING